MIKKVVKAIILLFIVLALAVLSMNFFVVFNQQGNIVAEINAENKNLTDNELKNLKNLKPDCILVLGAGVYNNERPSPMLKDRLDAGILLYKDGVAPKLLLSGDGAQPEYNEVRVMLKYVLERGVKKQDVFCDYLGLSTYDSLHRAKTIYGVKNTIVVTQAYHQYRALYIGNNLGINCVGVSSDQFKHRGQFVRDIREIFARDKDVIKIFIKKEDISKETYIGIAGDGSRTQHDE